MHKHQHQQMPPSNPTPTNPDRMGPQPFMLHWSNALMCLNASVNALPLWKQGLINWKNHLENQAEKLLSQSANLDTSAFLDAIHEENLVLLNDFLEGTRKYRFHPYQRNVREPAICTRFDNSVLYRYTDKAEKNGTPVFVIPSLVNKSHILDLTEDFSFMRFLTTQGFTPYMLDWGEVGKEEKTFSFTDYYNQRLIPALDYIAAQHDNAPVHTIGYCMGGTMAIALSCLRPLKVASLTLVAAPWDFHADNKLNAQLAGEAYIVIKPYVQTLGWVTPDLLQFFFTAVDPLFALKKYGSFAKTGQTSKDAERFVAVEDWLNDGVPLVEKVAETAFVDWYRDNKPVNNRWHVCNTAIDPDDLTMPVHVISAKRDRLVPATSSMAIPAHIRSNSKESLFDTGHIGLMAGSRAQNEIWPAISEWICATKKLRTAQ